MVSCGDMFVCLHTSSEPEVARGLGKYDPVFKGSLVPGLTFLGIGCEYEYPFFKLLPDFVI